MNKIKLACFDLDDTLIQEIHSVMLLCILNGRLDELLEIERREAGGELGWVEADYLKVKLAKGLQEKKIAENFHHILKPLDNIATTINALHKRNIRCVLITAGPVQVARIAAQIWGFDDCYGSEYEVMEGVFTGKILKHIGDLGKIACLEDCCIKHGIAPSACTSIGDGASDIPLFQYCGRSIAINYSDSTIGKATFYIRTRDLSEVLQYIKQ